MKATAGILEHLQHGIVLGAEGYVFELERRGYIQAGPFVPDWKPSTARHPPAVIRPIFPCTP